MKIHSKYPSTRMQRYMVLYRLLWIIGLPLALGYLIWRSIRDASYRRNLSERFGFYRTSAAETVWIHAVSMGEMRSAGPLVSALVDAGETVVLTHFTPAGRKEAAKLFGKEIASKCVHSVWVPVEFQWAFNRFFRRFSPKYGLVMEVEWWPMMILAAASAKLPLFACNAQYPGKSFARDTKKNSIRTELPAGFAGVLAKSETQAAKFRQIGVSNIAVTGELRFDQPIPPSLLRAATRFKALAKRPVITISSVVEGEDATYMQAMKYVLKTTDLSPVFIYVPRAPERFDECYSLLIQSGFKVARRSAGLDNGLSDNATQDWESMDVLLGDSMGEMYFYLALCDLAITGGGFAGKGAHNVIEPLALKKPVIVGPEIRTIEYPAVEAIEAGVLTRVENANALADEICKHIASDPNQTRLDDKISEFYNAHAGACGKTLATIPKLMSEWKQAKNDSF